MITCNCNSCGDVEVYENEKAAWLDGWDFIGKNKMICGKCAKSPAAQKNKEENEE